MMLASLRLTINALIAVVLLPVVLLDTVATAAPFVTTPSADVVAEATERPLCHVLKSSKLVNSVTASVLASELVIVFAMLC